MRESPYISILIPTYNTADWLEHCLDAVLAEHLPNSEIIVFDNASTDNTTQIITARYPTVRLLSTSPNIGYVRATNHLLKAAGGTYLILLDSDTTPEPGALRHLVTLLEENPAIGAVGPRLAGIDGRFQRWTAGRLPTFTSVSSFYLGLDRIAAKVRLNVGLFLARDTTQPQDVSWLCSCCLALRHQALREAGLMDERYASYLGDLDLCRRINEHGWRIHYDPRVTVLHAQGRNTAREPGYASPDTIYGLDMYLHQHSNGLTRETLRWVEASGYIARFAAYSAMSFIRKNQRARTMAHLHWRWFILRCTTAPATPKP